MWSPLCLCTPPPIEPIFVKLGMYIIATESVSMAYLKNPSQQSVCVFLLSMQGNGEVNTFQMQEIHDIIEVIFYVH
jgi:hypothetical protein